MITEERERAAVVEPGIEQVVPGASARAHPLPRGSPLRAPYWMMTPSLALLALIVFLPILIAFYLSLTGLNQYTIGVDATVITSPAEYATEKQGLRVIMSAQELGQLVRIPITGIGATLKKMATEPDEIVRLLRALHLATMYLLQNPEYSHALFQRIMHVEAAVADKLFKLYRDQYNPDLTLPDSVAEDLLAVGTFRLKEKPKAALTVQSVRDWSFAEKAKW